MTDHQTDVPNLSLEQAWDMLSTDPAAQLIDVRTTAEWSFVGVPALDTIGKQVRTVEWTRFPTGEANPDFLTQAGEGMDQDQPILLLCRSGARSMAAARALRQAGFTNTYNVAPGFEGDLNADQHREGGWKDNLPWRQG